MDRIVKVSTNHGLDLNIKKTQKNEAHGHL